MGLFGFKKKEIKSTPKYTDLDMVLGKAGQIDKNRLSKLMVNITDQASLENIALNSTIDQARMWAAGSLENKKIANDVYGQLKNGSSDPLIHMAANQEYKPDFE